MTPHEVTEARFPAKLSTQGSMEDEGCSSMVQHLPSTNTQGPDFIPSERLQKPVCEGSFASSLALVLSCWVVLCLNHFGKIPLQCNQYLQSYFMGQMVPNCTNIPQISALQRLEQVTA